MIPTKNMVIIMFFTYYGVYLCNFFNHNPDNELIFVDNLQYNIIYF